MEPGICLIAVFYFCIKTFFLYNVIGQQRYKWFWLTWCHRSRDHKTRSAWFPIGGPLTPTHG